MKKEFKGTPWPWEIRGFSVYAADGHKVMTTINNFEYD